MQIMPENKGEKQKPRFLVKFKLFGRTIGWMPLNRAAFNKTLGVLIIKANIAIARNLGNKIKSIFVKTELKSEPQKAKRTVAVPGEPKSHDPVISRVTKAKPRHKMESALAKVPQIGEMLVSHKILTKADVALVMSEIQRKSALHASDNAQPKPGFFGEEAMLLKRPDGSPLLTKEQLDVALSAQSKLKAEAAVIDIKRIIKGGELILPEWKKPHLGNGAESSPVNQVPKTLSVADYASAAANIAENIVLLANKKPEIAAEVEKGVIAGRDLILYISGGSKVDMLKDAFVRAATANNIDAKIVQDYNKAKISDISSWVERTKPADKPLAAGL